MELYALVSVYLGHQTYQATLQSLAFMHESLMQVYLNVPVCTLCPSQDGLEVVYVYTHTCGLKSCIPGCSQGSLCRIHMHDPTCGPLCQSIREILVYSVHPAKVAYIDTHARPHMHVDPCVRVSVKAWYTLPIPGWSQGRLCRYTYMSAHVNPSVREMLVLGQAMYRIAGNIGGN